MPLAPNTFKALDINDVINDAHIVVACALFKLPWDKQLQTAKTKGVQA